jgi:hypothetical protein
MLAEVELAMAEAMPCWVMQVYMASATLNKYCLLLTIVNYCIEYLYVMMAQVFLVSGLLI